MGELHLGHKSYLIMEACFEVYKEMVCGFVEPVYQECLLIELVNQSIPHRAQQQLQLIYKRRPLKLRFVPDFVCFNQIILEIKAVSRIRDEHRAQVHNYLKTTGQRLGLFVNFGYYPKLEWERIIL